MDTKSKKFKFKKSVKALVFIFMSICVAIGSFGLCRAIIAVGNTDGRTIIDALQYDKNGEFDLTYTHFFSNNYCEAVEEVMRRAMVYKDGTEETFKKVCDKEVEGNVNNLIDDIKSEIYVNGDYEDYCTLEYVCEGYVYEDPTSFRNEYDEEVKADKGYDGLWFDDGTGQIYQYKIDSKKVENSVYKAQLEDFVAGESDNRQELKKYGNLKYAVVNKTDKKVYSNCEGLDYKNFAGKAKKFFGSYNWNLHYNSNGDYELSPIIHSYIDASCAIEKPYIYEKDFETYASRYSSTTPPSVIAVIRNGYHIDVSYSDDYEIYVAFDDTLTENDVFYNAEDTIVTLKKDLTFNLALFSICAILTLACLIYFVIVSGRNEEGEFVLAFTDKIPNFLHLLISTGLIVGGFIIEGYLVVSPYNVSDYYDLGVKIAKNAAPVVAVIIVSIFAEWLTSFARQIKNKSVFGNTVLGKIVKNVKSSGEKISNVMPKNVIMIFSFVSAFYLFITLVISFAFSHEFAVFWLILTSVVFISFALYTIYKLSIIMNATDNAKNGNYSVPIDPSKFPFYLRKLAFNVANMQAGTREAIESAVRDQKMKTELITNVSHDLKTPLTAIINYVDLLGKCEIEDETAQEYIEVLKDKSERLKKLISDLVEASKASSGNIQVNVVKINLNETAIQIAGEMSDEFENNNLEIVTKIPQTPVIVNADGRLVFRIMENLMGNACKYSMPDTRVYLTVNEDGFISISNISKNPIEVSADELKNRFVRGDKSRSTEGSGLGLAIADDLCNIQGGKLNLYIDGDMFKATVVLPKCSVEESV